MSRTLWFPSKTLLLGLGLPLLAACSTADPEDGPDGPPPNGEPNPPTAPSDAPTFHENIQGLLQDNCIGCHREDGAAPIAFTDIESVKAWAPLMVRETAARRMPPWGAFDTEACQPRFGFKDDLRLEEAEIQMLKDWVDAGMPLGDPNKAPAAPSYQPLGLAAAEIDATFAPQTPHTVTGTRDSFRCSVVDPQLERAVYVDAANVVPGNPEVVHHVIVYTDPDNASAELAGPDGSYECFGGPGFGNTQILQAWAPGVPAQRLPENVGQRLEAGTKLIIQVHYHPSKPVHAPDLTQFELSYMDYRPTYVFQTALIGNFDELDPATGDGLLPGMNDTTEEPEFRIPAGATDHVEKMRFTLPDQIGNFPIPPLKVLTVGAHMHYVGTDLKFDIERAEPMDEPERECMVQTPQWDFQWQRGYTYDVEVRNAPSFVPGDKIHIECKFNNSMSNPYVVDAIREQGLDGPQDVVLGDETLDEMCLAVLGVAYENTF